MLCVGQRALDFLGFLEHDDFEQPWFVRYEPGQKFGLHVESAEAPYTDEDGSLYNKLATFFVYLEADCVGGETYFPFLPSVPLDANGNKFSRTASGKGMVFRPIRGNAIFWLNNHPNGTVHESTAHMGLPITEGQKIGMNIFTKQRWVPR
jgi:prolyl 4-hydroxylase